MMYNFKIVLNVSNCAANYIVRFFSFKVELREGCAINSEIHLYTAFR